MSKLEDLVLFESANSALAFREHAYAPAEIPVMLQDVLALANAEVNGPRFLFLGVRDIVGGKRTLPGLSPAVVGDMKRALPPLLARAIEPPFKIALRAMTVKHATIGLLCLSECENPPYLLRKSVAGLAAGAGWVRRGTQNLPLLRTDLQRMFEQKLASSAAPINLRVGFAGKTPQEEIALPVLHLEGLPSAIAARKLRKMLEAKESAKQILGKTQSQFVRLVHAQVFGADQAYESHSDESLRMLIGKAEQEYRAADEHYEFEIRAHKLSLLLCNSSNAALESVTLRLKLPRIPGIGVAEKLYSVTGSESNGAYPLVSTSTRTIRIQAEIGGVAPGAIVPVFKQAPRLWAREAAVGKSIPVDYTLHARQLREPLRDTLIIRIVESAASERKTSVG
ncbi:MAG TPA: hypothetical protein VJA26_08455 [Gammaproteobacteria bacterium]|nr:hypothetical protein [Gammaproteobacteria bacterium]